MPSSSTESSTPASSTPTGSGSSASGKRRNPRPSAAAKKTPGGEAANKRPGTSTSSSSSRGRRRVKRSSVQKGDTNNGGGKRATAKNRGRDSTDEEEDVTDSGGSPGSKRPSRSGTNKSGTGAGRRGSPSNNNNNNNNNRGKITNSGSDDDDDDENERMSATRPKSRGDTGVKKSTPGSTRSRSTRGGKGTTAGSSGRHRKGGARGGDDSSASGSTSTSKSGSSSSATRKRSHMTPAGKKGAGSAAATAVPSGSRSTPTGARGKKGGGRSGPAAAKGSSSSSSTASSSSSRSRKNNGNNKRGTTGGSLKLAETTMDLEYAYGYRGSSKDNLAYLPDGRVVYHSAALGIVHDPSANTQRFFSMHTDDIVSLSVHPKGNAVATGQLGRTPEVMVWDPDSMRLLATLKGVHTRGVSHVAFSPSGRLLATIGLDDSHTLAVYDWAKGKLVAQAKGHNDAILCLAWSSEEALVTGGVKHVKFWRIEGKLTPKRGQFGKVGIATVTAVGLFRGTVVTGTFAGDLLLWDPATAQCTGKIRAHTGPLHAVFSTGEDLATSGKDGRLVVWSAAATAGEGSSSSKKSSGRQQPLKLEAGAAISLGDFHRDAAGNVPCVRTLGDFRDGRVLIGTAGCAVLEFDFGTQRARVLVEAHEQGELWGLAPHPSELQFATASDDGTVRTWDAAGRVPLASLGVGAPARSVAYSPDASLLAVGLETGGFVVVSCAKAGSSLKALHAARDRRERIGEVRFSPDGSLLAVASNDNYVDLYECGSGSFKRVGVCKGASSYITHVDWSADSRFVRTNDGSYAVLTFDARDKGKRVTRLPEDAAWATFTGVLGKEVSGIWPKGSDKTDINGASVNATGWDLFATGDDFGHVRLFDWPPSGARCRSKKFVGHSAHVCCVRFSHDDSLLWSVGGADQTILQWRIRGPRGSDSDGDDSESDSSASSDKDEDVIKEAAVVYKPRPRPDPSRGGAVPARQPQPHQGQGGGYGRNAPPPQQPRAAPAFKPKAPGRLVLDYVHGYRSHDARDNLYANADGNLVYHAASVGIVLDTSGGGLPRQGFFTAHDDDIICLAMHPDGFTVATGQVGKDPTACVWDSRSLLSARGKGKGKNQSRTSVTGSSDSTTPSISSGRALSTLGNGAHERGICAIAFGGPDGSVLATVGLDDNHTIAIWAWAKGKKMTTAVGGKQRVFVAKFRPDPASGGSGSGSSKRPAASSEVVLVTAGVKHISFHTITAGSAVTTKKGTFGKVGKAQTVMGIAFDPATGDCIAAGSLGNVYRFRGNKAVAEITSVSGGPAHDTPCCAVHIDAAGMITGGKDGVVKLWSSDLATEEAMVRMPDQGGTPAARSIARHGDTVTVGTVESDVFQFAARGSREVKMIMTSHGDGELWGLAVSGADPTRFATCGYDNTLRVWSVRERRELYETLLEDDLRCTAWSPDGALIAAGTVKGVVHMRGAADLGPLAKAKVSKRDVYDLRFSPDSTILAAALRDRSIVLLEARSLKRLATCAGHSGAVVHVDWSTCGRFLQSNDSAHERLVWSSPKGKRVTRASDLEGLEWASVSGHVHPDTQGVLQPGMDGTDVNAVAVNPSRNQCVAGTDYGTVMLFPYPCRGPGPAAPITYENHSAHVTNVAFTPDGEYVLSTGGDDLTVMVWRVIENDLDESGDEADESSDEEVQRLKQMSFSSKRDTRDGKRAEESVPVARVIQGAEGHAAATAAASTRSGSKRSSSSSSSSLRRGGAAASSSSSASTSSAASAAASATRSASSAAAAPRAGGKATANSTLELEWVYGFGGNSGTLGNLVVCASGEMTYPAAGVAVSYSPARHKQQLFTAHSDDLTAIAVHPDGKTLATGQVGRRAKILVWDEESHTIHAELAGFHERAVISLDFDATGEYVASIGADDHHSLAVYDWDDKRLVASTRVSGDTLFACRVNPVTGVIVCAGTKHISFWQVSGNTLSGGRGVFGKQGRAQTIFAVCFGGRGGADCFTAGAAGDIHLWRPVASSGDFAVAATVAGHGDGSPVTSILALGRGGKFGFATGGKGVVRLWSEEWEPRSETPIGSADGSPAVVTALAQVGANGRGSLFAGTAAGEIREVAGTSSKIVIGGHGAAGELWGLDAHPTQQRVVTASLDKVVRLWDVGKMRLVSALKIKFPARAAAFSPRGTEIAIGGEKGEFCVLSVTDGGEMTPTGGRRHCKRAINALRYSPDGSVLAVVGSDRAVDLYSVANGYKRIARGSAHSSAVLHVDFSEDGSRLQTGSASGEHLVWSSADAQRVTERGVTTRLDWETYTLATAPHAAGCYPPGAQVNDVNSFDRSRSGAAAVTGDDNGAVKTFPFPTPAAAQGDGRSHAGHSAHVTCVRWTAGDERVVSTGGGDRCLLQWRVKP